MTRSPEFDSLFDHPKLADPVAHFHRPDFNLVFSSHHRYFIASLQLIYGTLRHQQSPGNMCEPSTRTRTNPPGRKTLSGLGNNAASRIVPVC